MTGLRGRASISGRAWWAAALAVGLLVIVVSSTTAFVGRVNPASCVADNENSSANCPKALGLFSAFPIAISRDGKSVYTTSRFDRTIVRFSRNPTSGVLTPAGCINDTALVPPDDCGTESDGLSGAFQAEVTRDGGDVYVTTFQGDESVTRFDRTASGALAPAGCIEDNDSGGNECAAEADGMSGAFGLATSPDGKSVYVSGPTDHAIANFDRAADGTLTDSDCIDDNTGPDSCGQTVAFLGAAADMVVSPDSKSLYVLSGTYNAVFRFNRVTSGPNTGDLSFASCVEDNDNNSGICAAKTAGLENPRGVAVSPDNKSVYVAGMGDGAIVRFDRDSNGALAPAGCVEDNDTGSAPCAQKARGLGGPISVAVSADNRSVYVGSGDSGLANDDMALVIFDRNAATGALTPRGCIDDAENGADVCQQTHGALHGVSGVGVSNDGRSVYVAAGIDSALVHFVRDFDPPETTVRGRSRTPRRRARFRLRSDEGGVSFECKLDRRRFRPCTSPFRARGLRRGSRHKLRVRATDQAGNVDPTPAVKRFRRTR